MKQTLSILGLSALLLMGCGSDDKKLTMDTACPKGADAGTEVACSCGDAGTGTAICQANDSPGACDCEGGAGAGGTSGGSGGAGGSDDDGGMSGSGGSGGSDDDGGMDPGGDGDGDASVPPLMLPDDGNQGSVCAEDRDCNRDLGCYNAGFEGRGFCSAICEMDVDCESLDGASYTCSMSSGVCVVACEGEDDTESCPEPMGCVNTEGFGGPGLESFRCKYPGETEPQQEPAELLEACSLFQPCAQDLVCHPTGAVGNGYCTIACERPDNCSELEDGAGDATPECTNLPGPTGGERCTLDCSEAPDGCPGDMTCITFGAMSRCGFE